MNIKSILDDIKCFIENPKSYALLYSKNDEIHNEYALSEKEGKLLLEYITKLQNNWNELKDIVNNTFYKLNGILDRDLLEKQMYIDYGYIRNKMQELEGNNE